MPTMLTTPRPKTRPSSANKRAINLSLNADVLAAARALEINISQQCDAFLTALVRQEQMRRWREDHADFVAAYNNTIATEGLPLDEWRSF